MIGDNIMRFVSYGDVETGRESYEMFIISSAIESVLCNIKDLSWQSDYVTVHDFIRDIRVRYGGSSDQIAIFDWIRNNL
jgi:hypothetical protein